MLPIITIPALPPIRPRTTITETMIVAIFLALIFLLLTVFFFAAGFFFFGGCFCVVFIAHFSLKYNSSITRR